MHVGGAPLRHDRLLTVMISQNQTLFLFSGALLLIPVGRISDVIVGWHSHIVFQLPYALICSALGAGFAFLSAILSIIGLCLLRRLKRQRQLQEEQDQLTLAPS